MYIIIDTPKGLSSYLLYRLRPKWDISLQQRIVVSETRKPPHHRQGSSTEGEELSTMKKSLQFRGHLSEGIMQLNELSLELSFIL